MTYSQTEITTTEPIAHKVLVISLTVSDPCRGLDVCQGKGKSTCYEHGKQLRKLLMLMTAFVSLLTLADDYSLGQQIANS